MGAVIRPLQARSPIVLSAFHSALVKQLLLVLAVLAILAIAVNVVRTIQSRRLAAAGALTFPSTSHSPLPEPIARRILRIGFGLLWVLDGMLQLQPSIPLSLPTSVLRPAASTSPQWVKDLVSGGATIWSNHPVQAASAVVGLEIGLGIWLLVAPRGVWSRVSGLAGAGWALVAWVFGEAFGGIFAPGWSWLLGAPGAALVYVGAGIVLALPERVFLTRRLGRIILAMSGGFFIAMAVLQAWPGRGYWQGRARSAPHLGTIAATAHEMAGAPQPAFLSSWVATFAAFDAAHGWAVNLAVVVALAATGIALCTGRRHVVLPALVVAIGLCLADWVLVQDLGVFGGVSTDPGSMVPLALILVGGYMALAHTPVPFEPSIPVPPAAEGRRSQWWESLTPRYLVRSAAAAGAIVVVLMGSVPLAIAAANPEADPIITEAINGTPNIVDFSAPQFQLVDQHGREITLSDLRGHAVALTFLDPVCTTDCPLIAQMFRQADQLLGSTAHDVDFVAVVANPIYRSESFIDAFDQQEGLERMRDWFYLTGSEQQLRHVWDYYGMLVATSPAGAMVAHGDLAYVIDPNGRERDILEADPGPNTSSRLSFAALLADRIGQALRS